ncbi:hypothetical protein RchiOBHm_Chr7g0180361 [Rosa chinensis]|uniref:Uncharacterized protein n=1 Tax=Rosa chinensis TaxID=74649 RepID=A0A2P6P2C8_ROSCH|nr:hypothetical protein RchiOBHm_Chr7g0180361 [Rosa chinensis]
MSSCLAICGFKEHVTVKGEYRLLKLKSKSLPDVFYFLFSIFPPPPPPPNFENGFCIDHSRSFGYSKQ